MEFKEKSRYVRKKLMLSQEEFAKVLNVSYPTVNRWENGKTEPNYKAQRAFHKLCEKNKINFDEELL